MKATGIVRRIDDLGRVVIPKEIRRTMHIRDGDPLEIFTGQGGEVVFKKYSPVGELSEFAEQYAQVMAQVSGSPILICDRERVIAAAGEAKKTYLDRPLSAALEETVEQRTLYTATDGETPILPTEDAPHNAAVVAPILSAGDVLGCVCLLESEKGAAPSESDVHLSRVAAGFFGKQMEE